MLPLDLSKYDIEFNGSIARRYQYDNATQSRTDIQATDDLGCPLWGAQVSIWQGDTREGDYRITIHSFTEPMIMQTGRHPLVKLKDPMVNMWNTPDGTRCNIHCWGMEDAVKPDEGGKK